MFLSETKSASLPEFSNYNHISKPCKNNPNSKGGVAILAHKSLSIDYQPQFENENIDACFAIITLAGHRWLMCSACLPPKSPDMELFKGMLQKAKSELSSLKCADLAVFGDFNARHVDWGDHGTNKAGEILSQYIRKENLAILDNFQGNTFLCDNGGSRIDWVFSDQAFSSTVEEQYTDSNVELFSGASYRGHIPLWTILNIAKNKSVGNHVWSWNNTNWSN